MIRINHLWKGWHKNHQINIQMEILKINFDLLLQQWIQAISKVIGFPNILSNYLIGDIKEISDLIRLFIHKNKQCKIQIGPIIQIKYTINPQCLYKIDIHVILVKIQIRLIISLTNIIKIMTFKDQSAWISHIWNLKLWLLTTTFIGLHQLLSNKDHYKIYKILIFKDIIVNHSFIRIGMSLKIQIISSFLPKWVPQCKK